MLEAQCKTKTTFCDKTTTQFAGWWHNKLHVATMPLEGTKIQIKKAQSISRGGMGRRWTETCHPTCDNLIKPNGLQFLFVATMLRLCHRTGEPWHDFQRQRYGMAKLPFSVSPSRAGAPFSSNIYGSYAGHCSRQTDCTVSALTQSPLLYGNGKRV